MLDGDDTGPVELCCDVDGEDVSDPESKFVVCVAKSQDMSAVCLKKVKVPVIESVERERVDVNSSAPSSWSCENLPRISAGVL